MPETKLFAGIGGEAGVGRVCPGTGEKPATSRGAPARRRGVVLVLRGLGHPGGWDEPLHPLVVLRGLHHARVVLLGGGLRRLGLRLALRQGPRAAAVRAPGRSPRPALGAPGAKGGGWIPCPRPRGGAREGRGPCSRSSPAKGRGKADVAWPPSPHALPAGALPAPPGRYLQQPPGPRAPRPARASPQTQPQPQPDPRGRRHLAAARGGDMAGPAPIPEGVMGRGGDVSACLPPRVRARCALFLLSPTPF